jgi:hypothetical protein
MNPGLCKWVACGAERFPAKWRKVRVKKTRQIKNLEPRSDFIGTDKALAQHAAHNAADEAPGTGGVRTGIILILALRLRLGLRL